jgi:hypothetical protein
MLKSLRKTLLTLGAALSMALVPAAIPVAVYAEDPNIDGNLACGSALKLQTDGCESEISGGTGKVQDIVTDVINFFSVIVGIVAVVMIIWGGFKYITSGGDSGNITSAKNTIIYAIIGLVIVAFAQFIVQFVLDQVIE